MRRAAAVVLLIGLSSVGAAAQGRGRSGDRAKGVPPGHMPPAGQCRVWYDGRPPGHQPAPTDCRTAEAIASRDPSARVIYGDDRGGRYERGRDSRDDRDYGYPDRRSDQYPYGRYPEDRGSRERQGPATGRAIPRGTQSTYPQGTYYPGYPGDTRYGASQPGWDAGYRDGLEKGREDVTRNRRYDPNRHQWYRSGTRGYDQRVGSKDEYINLYRDGFTRGYSEGFRR